MNKFLPLTLSFMLFLSVALYGQNNGNNNADNERGRTNLLLPHGNIGIGTLSPSEKLEVMGSMRVSHSIFAQSLEVYGLNAATITISEDLSVGRNILVNGNIGIGVMNPAERLELDGNLKVSNGIFTNTIEGNSFNMDEGTVENDFSVNGNTLIGGNVGIGNISPTEKLEVNGNIKATGDFLGQDLHVQNGDFERSVSIKESLAVEGTSDFTGEVRLVDATISNNLSSNVFTTETGTVNGEFNVGGNSLIGGNTGLGVAQPTERLEVEGNAKVSNTLYANALESKEISLENGNIENQLSIGGDALVSGNIGIGMEAPTEKLEVAGNIKATGNLSSENVSATNGDFATNVNIGNNLAVLGSSNFTGEVIAVDLTVSNTLNSSALSIENGAIANDLSVGGTALISGNVGIGNAAPAESLDVTGNIRASGNFIGENLTAANGDFATDVNIGQNLAVTGTAEFNSTVSMEALKVSGNLESNSLQAESGAFNGQLVVAGPVAMDSSLFVKGMIGIGTEKVEGYMLSVNGKIRAGDDIRVYSSAEWADFVFEESYALPSLKAVESYIHLHQHLPEIPSALTVKNEGIELGAMDAKLLRKIEELTLYTIAQEKALAEQKALFEQKDQEIKELRTELDELKELVKALADKK